MEDLEENVVALQDAFDELHARGAELQHLKNNAISALAVLQAERRNLAKKDLQSLTALQREIAAARLEGEKKRSAVAHAKLGSAPAVSQKQPPSIHRETDAWKLTWKMYWRDISSKAPASKDKLVSFHRAMVMARSKASK